MELEGAIAALGAVFMELPMLRKAVQRVLRSSNKKEVATEDLRHTRRGPKDGFGVTRMKGRTNQLRVEVRPWRSSSDTTIIGNDC